MGLRNVKTLVCQSHYDRRPTVLVEGIGNVLDYPRLDHRCRAAARKKVKAVNSVLQDYRRDTQYLPLPQG